MALQISVNKNYCGKEVNFQTAYLKIVSKVTTGNQVSANISIYSDINKEYTIEEFCDNFTIDISDSAINEYKQIYRQLKENKYMDAVDLLEDGQTA